MRKAAASDGSTICLPLVILYAIEAYMYMPSLLMTRLSKPMSIAMATAVGRLRKPTSKRRLNGQRWTISRHVANMADCYLKTAWASIVVVLAW